MFLSSRPSSRARLGSGLTKTFRLHSENNNARAYGFVRPGRAFSIQVPDLNWLPKTSDKLHKAEQMTMYSISSNLVALSDQVAVKDVKKSLRVFTLVLVLLILLNIERICDAGRTRLT